MVIIILPVCGTESHHNFSTGPRSSWFSPGRCHHVTYCIPRKSSLLICSIPNIWGYLCLNGKFLFTRTESISSLPSLYEGQESCRVALSHPLVPSCLLRCMITNDSSEWLCVSTFRRVLDKRQTTISDSSLHSLAGHRCWPCCTS
jgi:hypothetical protein